MPSRAKQERFTFADCFTWDEDEHIEWIMGETMWRRSTCLTDVSSS